MSRSGDRGLSASARRTIPLSRGLTFKQAAVTLLVVLLLGLVIGALQLLLDWRGMRAEVREGMERTLTLVQGSASEAAYQLHPELARQLVRGLFVFDMVQRVELRDDFGQVLAAHERAPSPASAMDAWAWLFSDITHFQRTLRYAAAGGAATEVGVLQVDLAAPVLARRFLRQTLRDSAFGIARAIFISALVVLLFYVMITRPLLRLSRAIAEVDPAQPGRWTPPDLAGHRDDELGQLVGHLRRLFGASQDALDARDRARQALTALTRELEERVQERTQDLECQKLEVERAFGELDRAHRDLSLANGRLLESHRYARRIQTAMLPEPGVLGDVVREMQVLWEPLHLVGGDWYWLERRGDLALILLVDCTGHGVPGAFITLVVASAVEQVLREREHWDPAAMLRALDREVRRRLRQDRPSLGSERESDDGLDAAILVWDAGAGRLTYAGVGGIPLLCVHADGRAATVRGSRGHLGYQSLPPPREIVSQTIAVESGATFFMMTDGISDQMGGEPRRLLGRRRVLEWLQANAAEDLAEQVQGLCAMLERYRNGETRRDDMTLVALRLP